MGIGRGIFHDPGYCIIKPVVKLQLPAHGGLVTEIFARHILSEHDAIGSDECALGISLDQRKGKNLEKGVIDI